MTSSTAARLRLFQKDCAALETLLPAGEQRASLLRAVERGFTAELDLLQSGKQHLEARLATMEILVAEKSVHLAAMDILVAEKSIRLAGLEFENVQLKAGISSVYEFRPLIQHFAQAWYAGQYGNQQVSATAATKAVCLRFFANGNLSADATAKLLDMGQRAYSKQLTAGDLNAIKVRLQNLYSDMSVPFRYPVSSNGPFGFHCGGPNMHLVLAVALTASELQTFDPAFPRFFVDDEHFTPKLTAHWGALDPF